ncbi:DNA replication and repair protein RecF [Candidatus Dojkabacteria bacterium]|nr:DNA replication and repair protein RecF [Candidatus Dojkabacteria bacterium]
MILQNLRLTNFRNLSGEFSLEKGVNIVVGENGVGKTNLLESIGFLSFGKSFRTSLEIYSISREMFNIDSFVFSRVSGDIIDPLGNLVSREVILERYENSNGDGCKKVLKIDGSKTSVSDFQNGFHSIIFSPNTIDLVTKSPSLRRRDLDEFLSSFDESYLNEISEYRKVVRNKNKILEKFAEGFGDKKELDFWNKKQIDLGSNIIYKRLNIIKEINPIIQRLAPGLFNLDIEDLCIEYLSKFTEEPELEFIRNSFADKVEHNLKKEVAAAMTLYGPQREDFKFKLNGQDLSEFGSRGQQRLFIFLYKIAQLELLEEKGTNSPILLLDDLYSELDKKVQKDVSSFLIGLENQVVVTTVSEKEINDNLREESNRITL